MKRWRGAAMGAIVLAVAAGADWRRGAARPGGPAGATAAVWRDDGHEIFRAIAYDAERAVLTVEFRRGYAYRYRGVPAETHRGFVTAREKGVFYNERLRGRYAMERAPDRCLTHPVPGPGIGPRAVARRG